MKKIVTFFLALVFLVQTVGAASISPTPLKASEINIPIGNTGKCISMQDLSTISVKDFEQLTGKDMKFADRMMLKKAQKQIRNSINSDGTVNNKQVEKFYKKHSGGFTSDFNIGGFALGFLLGLIGVLIAYIINNDNNSSRHKWAWIGWGLWVLLLIIFFI